MRLIALIVMSVVLLGASLLSERSVGPIDPARIAQHCNVLGDKQDHIKFYEVEGATREEIRQSLLDRGPQDFAGKRRFALTEWYVKWRWDSAPNGQPDYSSSKAKLKLNVTLPSLAKNSEVESTISSSWDEYLNGVLQHECVHLSHGYKAKEEIENALKDIAQRVPPPDYTAVNHELFSIVSRYQQQDIEYDLATQNGRLNGADWQ